jgi:uncharacterized phage protein (TIGR01671 family)
MKREILFRGYSEALNKWVEGNLINRFTDNDPMGIKYKSDFSSNLAIQVNPESFENCRIYEVHPDSVGQFTGLCDMEGNRVFEGDILKVGENLTCEVVYIGTNSDDYGDEINASFHAKIHQHDKVIPLDGYLKKYCKITGNTFKP